MADVTMLLTMTILLLSSECTGSEKWHHLEKTKTVDCPEGTSWKHWNEHFYMAPNGRNPYDKWSFDRGIGGALSREEGPGMQLWAEQGEGTSERLLFIESSPLAERVSIVR